MGDVIEMIPVCKICGDEVADGDIFFKHPKHGIVCENCPEFEDGGWTPVKEGDDAST